MSLSIADVRFEHHVSPAIGIGERQPRISWSFTGDVWNFIQQRYQIALSQNGIQHSPQIYEYQSPESVLVPWPGPGLRSRDIFVVQVRVKGEGRDAWSKWSDPATVEAGLLDHDDWTGSVLIHPSPECSQASRPVSFRKCFVTPQQLRHARLYASAHGVYKARLNGHYVGNDLLAPGWTSYASRLVYQTYDVTPLLWSETVNTLTVDVGEGWFSGRLGFLGGRRCIYGSSLGFIAKLEFHLEDGAVVEVCTDGQWVCSYGPIISSQIYDGERYDARLINEEYRCWTPVVASDQITRLVAPDGPPVTKTQELKPISISELGSRHFLVDFGQNFVGFVRLKIRGIKGTVVTIQHAEVLENGRCATRPLRFAKARDEIIAGDKNVAWEPSFTFHGFRYVEVTGLERLDAKDVAGSVIGTAMKRTGFFSCCNELLNRLHENTVWSMRSNFLSIPTDCPQRDERLGWTGDINVFAETANFLFDCRGMLKSWLKDLVAEQKDGVVPLTIPNVMPGLDEEPHAVWGDVAVMLPWTLFQASADISLLSEQYDSMKLWLQAIPRKTNCLWDYKSAWKLGDWLDPSAPPDDCGNCSTDPSFVADCFLVHVTTLMKIISELLDKDAEAADYARQDKELRAAFQREYVTPSGWLACDTQTAYALAIEFSLFETPEQVGRAAERLSTLVRRNSRFKIATGFAGTPYIGHALSRVGLTQLFYRMLLHRKNPSWLYPVTMGATTMWERWDSMLPDGTINPGEMTSFNHYALGAVCQWMHQRIAGLRPLEPGWKSFAVEPTPGGNLTWAEARYISAFGEIWVRWRLVECGEDSCEENMGLRLLLAVPPNTSARVSLPGISGVNQIVVGSGQHEWTSSFVPQPWPPKAEYPPFLERDDELPVDALLPCPWD